MDLNFKEWERVVLSPQELNKISDLGVLDAIQDAIQIQHRTIESSCIDIIFQATQKRDFLVNKINKDLMQLEQEIKTFQQNCVQVIRKEYKKILARFALNEKLEVTNSKKVNTNKQKEGSTFLRKLFHNEDEEQKKESKSSLVKIEKEEIYKLTRTQVENSIFLWALPTLELVINLAMLKNEYLKKEGHSPRNSVKVTDSSIFIINYRFLAVDSTHVFIKPLIINVDDLRNFQIKLMINKNVAGLCLRYNVDSPRRIKFDFKKLEYKCVFDKIDSDSKRMECELIVSLLPGKEEMCTGNLKGKTDKVTHFSNSIQLPRFSSYLKYIQLCYSKLDLRIPKIIANVSFPLKIVPKIRDFILLEPESRKILLWSDKVYLTSSFTCVEEKKTHLFPFEWISQFKRWNREITIIARCGCPHWNGEKVENYIYYADLRGEEIWLTHGNGSDLGLPKLYKKLDTNFLLQSIFVSQNYIFLAQRLPSILNSALKIDVFNHLGEQIFSKTLKTKELFIFGEMFSLVDHGRNFLIGTTRTIYFFDESGNWLSEGENAKIDKIQISNDLIYVLKDQTLQIYNLNDWLKEFIFKTFKARGKK